MKILIIEDEPDLRKVVQASLETANHLVEYAVDFKTGLKKIEDYQYDCILLDIMLPDGNGLDILQNIKHRKTDAAVIILSAKDSVEDKVNGLDLGADDYLAKPFHLAELHSRLNSIIRRKNHHGEKTIRYKNLSMLVEERLLKINDKEVLLNRKEFDLLYYFIIRPNKLLQKTTIAEFIWGDNADSLDRLDFIYSQIKNLKKKLKQNDAEVDIQAVYGIGYKLI